MCSVIIPFMEICKQFILACKTLKEIYFDIITVIFFFFRPGLPIAQNAGKALCLIGTIARISTYPYLKFMVSRVPNEALVAYFTAEFPHSLRLRLLHYHKDQVSGKVPPFQLRYPYNIYREQHYRFRQSDRRMYCRL